VTHDPAPLLCGTYAGYLRHTRAKETPCEECRAANTLYMRLWRSRTGNRSQHLYSRARERAVRRLIAEHGEEYRALYREERAHLDHERSEDE
jgi:hypothetical protein